MPSCCNATTFESLERGNDSFRAMSDLTARPAASRPRRSRATIGRLRSVLGARWLVALALAMSFRLDATVLVKPFDWGTSPLSEIQFFNEMMTWADASNQFKGPTAFRQRQATFAAMSRLGFEPAIAAVSLFDFARGEPKNSEPAFQRLLNVAKAGDVSAQCALYPIYFLSKRSFPVSDASAILVPLLQAGANRGHIACQFYLGVFIDAGREGLASDPARAVPLLTAAALQGSVRAQSHLAHRIGTSRIDDLRKAEEALCWMASTSRHSIFEGIDVFANSLRFKAMDVQDRTGKDDLLQRVDALINHWLVSRNPALARNTDPRECLSFRSER